MLLVSDICVRRWRYVLYQPDLTCLSIRSSLGAKSKSGARQTDGNRVRIWQELHFHNQNIVNNDNNATNIEAGSSSTNCQSIICSKLHAVIV